MGVEERGKKKIGGSRATVEATVTGLGRGGVEPLRGPKILLT